MKNEENELEKKNKKKNANKENKKRKKKRRGSSDGDSENSNKSKNKDKKNQEIKKEEKPNKMVYNDRFEIQTSMLLGRGSFGEIYITYDTILRNYCALKLESQKNKHPQLKTEKMVLETMAECSGFPKLIEFGTQNDYNYMAMEILGPNLSDLFEFCHHKFSIQTVLLIAIQVLSRLQDIHAKNYIHRDIKPENFLIGVEANSNLVFMIDFGLSRKYKDPKTMDHIPYRENRPLTGTARYASINTHLGIEQSRRDDLEAIGYVLIYFLKRRLPWQGCQGSNKQDKYNKILEKKLSIPTEILCKDLPLEFSIYMNYVKNIRFDERPDYNFLKGLFIDLLFSMYNEKFLFDWTLPNQMDEPPNKKKNLNESVVSDSKDDKKSNKEDQTNLNIFKNPGDNNENALTPGFNAIKASPALQLNKKPFTLSEEGVSIQFNKLAQNSSKLSQDVIIDVIERPSDSNIKVIKEEGNQLKIKYDNFSEKSDTDSQKTDENNNFDGSEFATVVNNFDSVTPLAGKDKGVINSNNDNNKKASQSGTNILLNKLKSGNKD